MTIMIVLCFNMSDILIFVAVSLNEFDIYYVIIESVNGKFTAFFYRKFYDSLLALTEVLVVCKWSIIKI